MCAAAVMAVVVLNYVVGPPTGSATVPTSRLHVLDNSIQVYVNNLHVGAAAFAEFPVPAKMYFGGPGAPHFLYEVMRRSQELDVFEDETPESIPEMESADKWPRYAATYREGVVYTVGITQVRTPYAARSPDRWFGLSSEPGIAVENDMSLWWDYIHDAVRQDPASVHGWSTLPDLKIMAGLALAEAGEYAAALELFEAVLVDRPRSPDAMWNLAFLYAQFERFEEAERISSRFLRIHPNDPRAETLRQWMARPDR
jgi:tetratricopeptide (TPR) repeat protein